MDKFNGKIVIMGEGGMYYEKNSQAPATYEQFDQYARKVADELRKQKKEFMATIINKDTGRMVSQLRSKLFTTNK